MKILTSTDTTFWEDIHTICKRPAVGEDLELQIDKILDDVKTNGDDAIQKYAKKFDEVNLKVSEFLVTDDEIRKSSANLTDKVKKAIQTAYENVFTFSCQRVPETWHFSPRNGVHLGERYVSYTRVGAYIPGGKAPLISTVFHK